jgi:hypothetical protein
MISSLLTQTSCLLFVAAGAGGGYLWYNGRIEKNIVQDKSFAHDIALSFLESKNAVFTTKKSNKLEGEIPGEMRDGERSIYKISFSFSDFEHLKPKDPNKPTEDESLQIKREKKLKTKVIFHFNDGIKPSKTDAENYFNEYLNLLN